MKEFESGMIKLAREYQAEFFKDRDFFLSQVGKFQSIRSVLIQVYTLLVKHGKCDPIEKLSETDKWELWNEAKRISEVQEVNYLKDVCKALHGLGQFIQIDQSELNEIGS